MAERRKMKTKMRELLLFIPNLLRLLFALLKDPRISSADKAIIAGIIMYVIVPIDVIPDFIPFIGQMDDSYLLAIGFLRLLNRAEYKVIMDHWKGEVDIKELVTNISKIAEYFLPKTSQECAARTDRAERKAHGHLPTRPRMNMTLARPISLSLTRFIQARYQLIVKPAERAVRHNHHNVVTLQPLGKVRDDLGCRAGMKSASSPRSRNPSIILSGAIAVSAEYRSG